MRLLAIDPGNEASAWVWFEDSHPQWWDIDLNDELLRCDSDFRPDHVAIEYMRPRGMPTSKEEMDTQFWAGRLVQWFGVDWTPIFRHDVKLHLCGHARAKDANIRQALIDRYGGKEAAIGTKKNPGPLYGIKADLWSALAIGVTWLDTRKAMEVSE